MALKERIANSDVVWDAKRCKGLYGYARDEWDAKCRKIWDGRNRGDDDYYQAVNLILAAAGIENPCGREQNGVTPGGENVGTSRGRYPRHVSVYDGRDLPHKEHLKNVISSDENVSDDEVDPQFVAVLGCMKENGNAYALEDENDGSPLLCVYEGESSVGEVSESEWPSKKSGFKAVEKLGLVNHEQETNANFIGQKGGEDFLGMDNVKCFNDVIFRGSNHNEQERNYQVTREPVERTDVAQTGKKGNIQSNGNVKEMVKERNAARGDFQSNRNQKRIVKEKNVATGDNDAYKKAGIQKSKAHMFRRYSPRLNLVTEGLNTTHDISQQGQNDKVQNLAISNKKFKEKTLVIGSNEPVRRLNKRSREEKSKSDSEARDKQEKVLRSQTKTEKIVKQQKWVNGDHRRLVKLDNLNVHKKRGAKEIHFEPVDHDRPYKESKVDRWKKSKNVIIKESAIQMDRKRTDSTKYNREKLSDEDSTDVEILDSAEIMEEGNSSCFVPGRRHTSEAGCSSAHADFRRSVIKVIKKPYNRDEYLKLFQAFKPYRKQHSDLQRKLTKYRSKLVKRLGILRGFFYWVQNLVHGNAFKPWKDKECLAVEPGSA